MVASSMAHQGVGQYSRQLQVNTLGTVRTSKAFLPLLRQTKNSRVVIVTSAASRAASPGIVAYSMSKFAVRAFADGLRNEVRDFGMSVATIEPTMYGTNMANRQLVLKTFNELWQSTAPAVQAELGSKRFEELHQLIETTMDIADPAVGDVVDNMVLAIKSKCPEQAYCVGKRHEKLFCSLGQLLSEEVSGDGLTVKKYHRMLKMMKFVRKTFNI
ncbi:3beta-hydroxysteroid dehydrogenase dhs-16 [Halotydeus destructor]|nr:3beta-hydroxysteroid dehydrogenase dhs-16 [Halotydeus destructor]